MEGGLQLEELLVLLHVRRALELLFGCKNCVTSRTGARAFGVCSKIIIIIIIIIIVCVPLWPAAAAGWGSLVHV